MVKRCIGIALLVLLGGCGGGGEPPGRLEAPEFDLTGRWVTTEIACDSFSGDLPGPALAELDGQLEHEALESPGVRVVQMGNDLEITDLETGGRWGGTIAGDQIRYTDSHQRDVGGLNFDVHVEVEGTALDADRIAGTYELDWTFEVGGRTVTGGTLCTGRMERQRADEDEVEPNSTGRGDAAEPLPLRGAVVVNTAGMPAHHWGDDAYELETAGDGAPALEGDVLALTVSFSGGCARHDFNLVAGDEFMESDPVQLGVRLVHDDHDDPCEAYPTELWEFDLTPVKELYRDAYQREDGVIELRLHRPAPFPGRPVPESVAVTYAFE